MYTSTFDQRNLSHAALLCPPGLTEVLLASLPLAKHVCVQHLLWEGSHVFYMKV